MAGMGCDGLGLAYLLTHLTEGQRRDLCDNYITHYQGNSLAEDIEDEMGTGIFGVVVRSFVEPPEWLYAHALYDTMLGGLTGIGCDEIGLTTCLNLARPLAKEVEKAFRDRTGAQQLLAAIKDNSSGGYQSMLLRTWRDRYQRAEEDYEF